MLEISWPWIFCLLPLPWFVWRFVKPQLHSNQAALRTPFLNELQDFATHKRRRHRIDRRWLLITAAIAWLLLVVAAARPQWIGDPIQQATSRRDLMMAVDLSGSMQEKDFQLNDQWVDRLTATKWVANRFIQRRRGDRIGLILFGDQAYLQAPLTRDRKTIQNFLDEAVLGLAGREFTSIGDAIGLAVKRLQHHPAEQRVLLLLTDGANTGGAVSPLQAAELAQRYQIKIYTVGIGADELIVRDFFGSRRVNPSRDLDEKTLKAIADLTGGRYFRARNVESFEQIYALIDTLEPVEQDAEFYLPKSELYPWPLALALLLSGVVCGIKLFSRH